MTHAPRTTARSAAAPRRPGGVVRCSTALLAASALALAGCSEPDDGADSATSPAPAASSSASAPPSASASSSATGTASGSDAAAGVADALAASREAGSGTFDVSSETSAGGQVVTATGQGSFDDATGALQMQLTSPELPGQGEVTLELRQVDGAAYVSGLPGRPDQWVEVPLEELGAAGGPLGGADPSQQLTLLEQVGDDVEQVGQEQVAGVETTRYTGVVDLEAAAEQAQQEGADAEQLQQYEQLGLSTVPFDLFVGPDGLPVRLVTTVETSTQGQQVSSTSTVDFADWGADVQVEAPEGAVPLSDVVGAPTPAG